jgi:glucose 1-dehydrogenase
MIDLKGHAVLVTGSSKGVGRSIAEACAHAGADVLIHGRSLNDDARQALDRCRSFGVRSEFIPGDLAGDIAPAVDAVFQRSLEVLPHLDILVNNAGQYFDLPFLEMTVERFEKTMRLNVGSAYFLTQRFARHWIAQNTHGRVLMIGSINGRMAELDSTCYDTSKGAIEMMVKALAANLAGHGIRVNGLAPGLVRTPQTSWIDAPERADEVKWIAHHTPNGLIPHSDVCGPGAVYLVSDDAEHVHGQMLLIDGGMSAWQQPGVGNWRQQT